MPKRLRVLAVDEDRGEDHPEVLRRHARRRAVDALQQPDGLLEQRSVVGVGHLLNVRRGGVGEADLVQVGIDARPAALPQPGQCNALSSAATRAGRQANARRGSFGQGRQARRKRRHV